jgi:hypothetical protein
VVQQVGRDNKGTSFHLIPVGTNLKRTYERNVVWADLVRFMSGLGRGMIGPLNRYVHKFPTNVIVIFYLTI